MVENPTIEPFQFIRSTAFSERVQLANKLNEVIDALNQIETVDDLQTQIDTINSEISEIQSALAETDSDVSSLSNQVNTLVSEVNGLLKEVVSEVVLDAPEYGQVRVKVIHEDDTETASNALQIPVIVDGGISLISGTTARSFKIRYITADGVTHTTNDFVIPEGGGGTDVTVTSVSIEQGDTSTSFKFEIGLSDGSSIQSNSYPFPPGTELTPATTSQLGGIKVGTHLSVTADGTLSVDMTTIGTAAKADSIMWTADPSKVTLHADSIAGSKFTKDIPQASQGGAGTIDQTSYAKIAATESKVNALAPTVTVNDDVSPAQITVAINGKSSTANLPSGSGGNGPTWEPLDLENLPKDWKNYDIFAMIPNFRVDIKFPSDWNSQITPPTVRAETDPNPEYPGLLLFVLTSNNNGGCGVYTRAYTHCVLNLNTAIVYGINTYWNGSGKKLIALSAVVFNGQNCVSKPFEISKSNIKSYVKAAWRVRLNLPSDLS